MLPPEQVHDLIAERLYESKRGAELRKYLAKMRKEAIIEWKNDELRKAGVLLSLDGLHPPTTSARVRFAKGKPSVADGPFAESKEIVGGYWMIQVKSRDEAIEWARRCPAQSGETIEIRRVFEMEDFPADIQAVAR